MNKLKAYLILTVILLTACGTTTKQSGEFENLSRDPSALAPEDWKTSTIKDEDIEQAAQRALNRVEESRRKSELFRTCGAHEFVVRGGFLERDLLLIRLTSWDRNRFEERYRKVLTVRSRRCLWNSQVRN